MDKTLHYDGWILRDRETGDLALLRGHTSADMEVDCEGCDLPALPVFYESLDFPQWSTSGPYFCVKCIEDMLVAYDLEDFVLRTADFNRFCAEATSSEQWKSFVDPLQACPVCGEFLPSKDLVQHMENETDVYIPTAPTPGHTNWELCPLGTCPECNEKEN